MAPPLYFFILLSYVNVYSGDYVYLKTAVPSPHNGQGKYVLPAPYWVRWAIKPNPTFILPVAPVYRCELLLSAKFWTKHSLFVSVVHSDNLETYYIMYLCIVYIKRLGFPARLYSTIYFDSATHVSMVMRSFWWLRGYLVSKLINHGETIISDMSTLYSRTVQK